MSPYFSPRYHFKAQAKSKSRSKKKIDWVALGLLFVGALTFFTVLFPSAAGTWGKKCSQFLGWLSGSGRYGIPVLVALLGWDLLLKKEKQSGLLKRILIGILYVSFLVFLSLVGQSVWNVNYGGVIGFAAQKFLVELFGIPGTWILIFAGLVSITLLLLGRSPGEAFHGVWNVLKTDWQDWQRSKASTTLSPVVKEKKPAVVQPSPALTPLTQNGGSPRIIGASSEKEFPPAKSIPKKIPAGSAQTSIGTELLEQEKIPVQAVPYTSPSL